MSIASSLNFKITESDQGGFVRLRDISHKIVCANCGHYLILCSSDKAALIKTHALLFDLEKQEFILKCGKCLQFNTILISELRNSKSVAKLII